MAQPCKEITHENKDAKRITLLDGKRVYTTHILASASHDGDKSVYYYDGSHDHFCQNRIATRGCEIASIYVDNNDYVRLATNINSPLISNEYHITQNTISVQNRFSQSVQVYRVQEDKHAIFTGTSRSTVFIGRDPSLLPNLHNDIYTISGDFSIKYYYNTGDIIIALSPVCGNVTLHSTDGRFICSFYREDDKIMGPLVRTRLIPFMEEAQEGEEEGYTQGGLPIFISYYSPTGERLSSSAQYKDIIRQRGEIIQRYTGLPRDVLGLVLCEKYPI